MENEKITQLLASGENLKFVQSESDEVPSYCLGALKLYDFAWPCKNFAGGSCNNPYMRGPQLVYPRRYQLRKSKEILTPWPFLPVVTKK